MLLLELALRAAGILASQATLESLPVVFLYLGRSGTSHRLPQFEVGSTQAGMLKELNYQVQVCGSPEGSDIRKHLKLPAS